MSGINDWLRPDYVRPEPEQADEPLYVVRLWDGFDGEWMDVSDPLPKAEADKLCGDKNEARIGPGKGRRDGNYNDIDYFKVFPADTRMVFSDGNSMTGRS